MNENGDDSRQRSRSETKASLLPILLFGLVMLGGGCSRKTELKQDAATASQLPGPEFSPSSGVYTNALAVRLVASTPGAVIRYTLDGSEPTRGSRKYAAPMQIADSTLLKAKVFGTGSSNSATASQSYILLNPDLAGFDSNLPLIIVNTFKQSIPHEKKIVVSARVIDAREARSRLTDAADFDGRADFNVRGHTSLRYPKRSYHLKTVDDQHNAIKGRLLGFAKDSDWVLYAPYADKTLMRDVLGYEISNQMGRYAPRTKFVEVFVNEFGGRLGLRDYLGVYVFEEKIKRGKHRVDIEKLEPGDNVEPNISGGYIFKKDHLDRVEMGHPNTGGYPTGGGGRGSYRDPYMSGPGGFPGNPDGFLRTEGRGYQQREGLFQGLAGLFSSGGARTFTSSKGNNFFYVEPGAEEITAPQRAWLAHYVNQCEEVLYGPGFKDPKAGYAAYLDADSFIDHHFLVEV